MLPRVASICLRLARPRGALLSHFRCYSTGSPFPIDPLVADVLKEPVKRGRRPAAQPSVKVTPKSTSSELEFVDISRGDLPPIMEWRKHFPPTLDSNHRISIRNPETAAAMADAFVPEGSNGKVVIEAFPGPGQLTRALLALPKERIRKLIIMEANPHYLKYLRPLEALDPRVTILPHNGYDWDSYDLIESMGLLEDVPKIAWDTGAHPSFQFISHIPSTVVGEQLVSQLFRSIPEGQWLFRYGRIPLGFILNDNIWKRISAPPGEKSSRSKLSVIAEAVAECTEALPFSRLQPFEEHFHPARSIPGREINTKYNARRVGNPYQVVNILPLEHQAISKGQLDKWDYCLRRLFVRKATPLKVALGSLAPGAQSLVKLVTKSTLSPSERVDVTKPVAQLTIQEWTSLVQAFSEWPFAPENLSIDDSFVMKEPR